MVSLECKNIRAATGYHVGNEQRTLAKGLAWNAKKFGFYTLSNGSLVIGFYTRRRH